MTENQEAGYVLNSNAYRERERGFVPRVNCKDEEDWTVHCDGTPVSDELRAALAQLSPEDVE